MLLSFERCVCDGADKSPNSKGCAVILAFEVGKYEIMLCIWGLMKAKEHADTILYHLHIIITIFNKGQTSVCLAVKVSHFVLIKKL